MINYYTTSFRPQRPNRALLGDKKHTFLFFVHQKTHGQNSMMIRTVI